MKNNNEKKSSLWKSLQVGIAVLFGLVIYAYGFQITKVDLEDLRSERRQESLTRVMRALARPEIIEYEQATEIINSPVYVTCPAGGIPVLPEPDKSGPYPVITPPCAEPEQTVQVEGFNFAPNTSGPLRFVTDLKMPGMDGMELLQAAKARDEDALVLEITAYGSLESAEEAMAEGAFDYITKPFRKEQILLAIDKAMRWREMVQQNKELRKKLESGGA